jgi:hypothetical protein
MFPEFSISNDEIARICLQLEEHKLIDAGIHEGIDGFFHTGSILTARGIDVVESGISPDIRIDLMPSQNITISGSSNIVVGNHNSLVVKNSIEELVKIIEASTASIEDKQEAKSLLKQFLSHPLLASVVGAGISLL